jgi:2-dehydropantoate 2-reductase
MKILIFGAGALGSFIGGLLTRNHDVTFVGNKAHLNAIKAHGLKIIGKTHLTAQPIVANVNSILRHKSKYRFDIVILTVKSYDTLSAMKIVKKIIHHNTNVLTLQNGLDNIDKITKYVDKKMVFGGVTSHGITFISPGVIKHAGIGDTTIGSIAGSISNELTAVADAFNTAGIKTAITKNIHREIWCKAIVNATINPLTAILKVPNGYLLKHKHIEDFIVKICAECVAVANTAGLDLKLDFMLKKTKTVIRQTSSNKSSMLQDIERGKPTEINSINGAIVRIAHKHKVAVPYNELLVALVKSIELKVSA